MSGVQTISRKGRPHRGCGILRDFTPDNLSARLAQVEEKVRPAWRHAEAGRNDRPPWEDDNPPMGNNLSEIPCRVSNIARGESDLVQTTGSNRWNPPDVAGRRG